MNHGGEYWLHVFTHQKFSHAKKMKRWCCIMDCNCSELLKRGVAEESMINQNSSMNNTSIPNFSSFFSDFQSSLKGSDSLFGTNNNRSSVVNNVLPDTSHTSLLYTTFIRSFSSCTHQVMVMESENTSITFLPILDPEEQVNQVPVNRGFNANHSPPSLSMLLIVADVLRTEDEDASQEDLTQQDGEENAFKSREKSEKSTRRNRIHVITQQFCNETFLKILESLIYLFISKSTLSSITTKQPSDKVAKKIPQVKITLNSMTDSITYLLQSSSASYSPIKSFDSEPVEHSSASEYYLKQSFEQLCLRPGKKTFRFTDVKDAESTFQKLLNSIQGQFKNLVMCSAIYVNNGLYFCGVDWSKYLTIEQLTALSVFLKSLTNSENESTTRDFPIIVKESLVNTRFVTIKLIDKVDLCVLVSGDIRASDIVNIIQSKSDDWSRAVIKLSNILARSLYSLLTELDEKSDIILEHLHKVRALLFINNATTNSFPHYIYENFVNHETNTVLHERVEHTIREFYINSMMTVFDVFQSQQGDEYSAEINETYMITKEFAMSAYKKSNLILFCVFDSTCPRHEFSAITQEILQTITRKAVQ